MTSNSRLDVDGDPDLDADIEIIKPNFYYIARQFCEFAGNSRSSRRMLTKFFERWDVSPATYRITIRIE